jgi:hypothetical protein
MGLLKGIWIEERTREVHLTQIGAYKLCSLQIGSA